MLIVPDSGMKPKRSSHISVSELGTSHLGPKNTTLQEAGASLLPLARRGGVGAGGGEEAMPAFEKVGGCWRLRPRP